MVNDKSLQSLNNGKNLLKTEPVTHESWKAKANEIRQVKERLLNKIEGQDEFSMTWLRCSTKQQLFALFNCSSTAFDTPQAASESALPKVQAE